MLFEAYLDLQRTTQGPGATRTFDEVRRRMADYVVAGLQLAPRRRHLHRAARRDPRRGRRDRLRRRGASSPRPSRGAARAPARSRRRLDVDFTGVVEDFGLKSRLVIGEILVDDSSRSCDADGVLDADERGAVRVTVTNSGASTATGAVLTVSSTSPGITFPDGPTIALADIPPHSTAQASVTVALDPSAPPIATTSVGVQLDEPSGCTATQTTTAVFRTNYDDLPGQGTTDDEEAFNPDEPAWTPRGPNADDIWSRVVDVAPNHVLRGIDYGGGTSDTALLSPLFQVDATASFTVTFHHRYSFETDTSTTPSTFYDGAVLEISDDSGATWRDVTAYGVTPGYGGTLFTGSGNVLGGQQAYVGRNASYPAMDTVSLDFGTQLAGKVVRMRFRIVTDAGAGDEGMTLDDFTFTGVDNHPFGALLPDRGDVPGAAGRQRRPGPGRERGGGGHSRRDRQHGRGRGPAHLHVAADGRAVGDAERVHQRGGRLHRAGRGQRHHAHLPGEGQRRDVQLDGLGGRSGARPGRGPGTGGERGRSVGVGGGDRVPGRLRQHRPRRGRADLLLDADGRGAGVADRVHRRGDRVRAACGGRRHHAHLPGDGERRAHVQHRLGGRFVQAVAANLAPVANGGSDQTVKSGDGVVMNGSGSSDPEGAPLTYAWTQTGGPSVTLEGATSVIASFTAPQVKESTQVLFQLVVNDGSLVATDTVTVTVEPRSGCGCTSGAGAPEVVMLLGGAALLARRRRRRAERCSK